MSGDRLTRGPGAPRAPLRTLGLLGDLHAEAERLAVAIDVLSARGVDRLAAVGDVCDGDGDLAATVALLDAHGVLTVRGNHDRWFLADERRELPFCHRVAHEPDAVVAFVRTLPPALELATAAGPVLLGHGVGRDDMAAIDPETPDRVARWHRVLGELLEERRIAWVLGGHTHRFMLRRLEHLGLVNAGALSRRDEGGGDRAACFLRLDFEARSVERWTFVPGAAEPAAVETFDLP